MRLHLSQLQTLPSKQQLHQTTNVVINQTRNWIIHAFKRYVWALFIGMKSSEPFPFASFVWLCFNPSSFFYVPGHSNVRTVADNKEIKPHHLDFNTSLQNSEPFGHWLHRWKTAEISDSQELLVLVLELSDTQHLLVFGNKQEREFSLREFQCMTTVGLRDKFDLYD